jgi:hypothetical protein
VQCLVVLFVDVHYPAAIAVARSQAWNSAHVDHIGVADFPVSPRRLGPSKEPIEFRREISRYLVVRVLQA